MTSPNRKFSPFRIFAIATASCLFFVGACGGGGGEDKGPNAESSSENATGDSASTQESQSYETPSGGDCVLEVNADCSGADLSGQDLSAIVAPGINLRGANLSGTILDGALLVGAKLTGADLSGASLAHTNLSAATLTQVRAPATVFFETNLTHADLTQADLNTAVMIGTNLSSANLTGASVEGLIDRRTEKCGTIWADGSLDNSGC
tara:strand:- start:1714 stop:2334 length:621 start_codon:yes stop_codon:yes gene_type:complete